MPYRRTRRTRNRRFRNRRIGRRRLLALSRRGPRRRRRSSQFITPRRIQGGRKSSLSPYRAKGGQGGSVYQALFNKKLKRKREDFNLAHNVNQYLGGGATALAGLGWLNHKLNSYRSRAFNKWARLGDSVTDSMGRDPITRHLYYNPPSDHVV